MENKYYTPEIEEFHVGFEFEQDSGYEWVKRVFKDMGGIYNLDNAINQKGLRVKYLDREDIESLGFTYIGEDTYSTNYTIPIDYDKCTIHRYHTDLLYLAIKKYDGHLNLSNGGTYEDEDGITLIVKNKSELKRILKQIGI